MEPSPGYQHPTRLRLPQQQIQTPRLGPSRDQLSAKVRLWRLQMRAHQQLRSDGLHAGSSKRQDPQQPVRRVPVQPRNDRAPFRAHPSRHSRDDNAKRPLIVAVELPQRPLPAPILLHRVGAASTRLDRSRRGRGPGEQLHGRQPPARHVLHVCGKISCVANETRFNLNLNTNSTTRAIILGNLVENNALLH